VLCRTYTSKTDFSTPKVVTLSAFSLQQQRVLHVAVFKMPFIYLHQQILCETGLYVSDSEKSTVTVSRILRTGHTGVQNTAKTSAGIQKLQLV